MRFLPNKTIHSVIPEGFRVAVLDLGRTELAPLVRAGCGSVIDVDSPSGWYIERSGNVEPEHLDLFFIVTGSILAEGEKGTLRAVAGQILLVNSNTDRRIRQDEASCHVYARFDNPPQYPLVKGMQTRPCATIDAIHFYLKRLIHAASSQVNTDEECAHLVELLRLLLVRELRENPADGERRVRIDQVMKLIRETDVRHFSVHNIAERVGMSISTFRKFCLENFGKSPGDVLTEFRMNNARGLLLHRELSIDEIAIQLGYADRFTFSKAFSQFHQCSPAAFREKSTTRNS